MILVIVNHLFTFANTYISDTEGRRYSGYSIVFWVLVLVAANCGVLLIGAFKSARL